MMKIVVMTDVHANLPALEAALNRIERYGYDLLVVTGDVIGIGPFPAEVLDRLLSLSNVRFVMGNHDVLFAEGLPNPRPDGVTDGEVRHQRWTHAQIDPALKDVVRSWPYYLEERFGTLTFSFLHYAMGEEGQFQPIVREATGRRLDELFSPYAGNVIFYGHHHPFSDLQSKKRYINPGSLGCSPISVARFCIVETDGDQYVITHHSVPYDDGPLAEAMSNREVPQRHMINEAFYRARLHL